MRRYTFLLKLPRNSEIFFQKEGKKEIWRVKGEDPNYRKFAPTRPEGAEAPSPEQSPWVNQQSAMRPERAKALIIRR